MRLWTCTCGPRGRRRCTTSSTRFSELRLIFLAYTRSISRPAGRHGMSMDEFHDFVDVGLETKDYEFDVMCNQFIKANATNTAQVLAAQEEKRDAQSRGNDKDWQKEKVGARSRAAPTAPRSRRIGLSMSSSTCSCASLWRQPQLRPVETRRGRHRRRPSGARPLNMLNDIIFPAPEARGTSPPWHFKKCADEAARGSFVRCA